LAQDIVQSNTFLKKTNAGRKDWRFSFNRITVADMTNKKLYRSSTNSMITGVCGGLAEYIEIDATVLRLIWAVVVVFTGFVPGILVYIVAAIIMPLEPSAAPVTPEAAPNKPTEEVKS
jgi:phage shock protein C